MDSEKPEHLNVCIIGAGRMGKLRAKLLYANPRIIIKGVIDTNEKVGTELANKYRKSYYSCLDDFLLKQNEKIHAVFVSVGTEHHYDVIKKAADNGISIFCEKPIDSCENKIKKIYSYCKTKGVKLCCGFQRRFDTSYINAKNDIHYGKIGKPLYAHITFCDNPSPPISFLKSSGGDPFIDLAPHDIDFICWCLGKTCKVDEIEGIASSSTTEIEKEGILDNAVIKLRFKDGFICNLFLYRSSTYGYDQKMEIIGTKGKIIIDNSKETEKELLCENGLIHSKYKFSFEQRYKDAFEMEISEFIDTILLDKKWSVTEEDCIVVQKISNLASKSNKLCKKIRL